MEEAQVAKVPHETNDPFEAALQHYFGFDSFKGNQEAIIKSIYYGHDTFVIMPTGGGKSLCYQLPALMMEGTAIIISPLIALMKNQVDHLRTHGDDEGIAHFLNSSLSKKQKDQVKTDILDGKTKLLYVAPESLTKESTVEFLQKITVSFVAVDEAHCISEWGHDFRPEYRRIRTIVEDIGVVPIIALTASATPKVQEDILKNLSMDDENLFKSSFNRSNLYYEVRPKITKDQTVKEIVSYLQKRKDQSGIIYCLSRKSVESLAETLQVNGIRALPYHAGMDGQTRTHHQDQFLMEEVDVIVATIAFGMGIDKPDVRFVIHYDVPKSLESYYQETGRAGRDDRPSDCIMFYNYHDLLKLEKFLKDKPVSEREVGEQLLNEMAAFAENNNCRRKSLLHYFGEGFNTADCNGGCDNCRNPKEVVDGQEQLVRAIQVICELEDKHSMEHVIKIMQGTSDDEIRGYGHDKLSTFANSQGDPYNLLKSVIRQAMIRDYLEKDIESYGMLKTTARGRNFVHHPEPLKLALDTNFETITQSRVQEDESEGGAGYDETLFSQLKDLRKRMAKEKDLPPYIIFQENSLEEMAIKYPTSRDELSKISGISGSKADKYGQPFLNLISDYVEEHDIQRPDDFVVKSVANKSKLKVYIIQGLDRKLTLEEMAEAKGLSTEEVMEEVEQIVYAGTKVNINHEVDDMLDPEHQEEIYEYFREADTDSIDEAIAELGEDAYSREELKMMRIKFISEMAN